MQALRCDVLVGDANFLKELHKKCATLVGEGSDEEMHVRTHTNPNRVWNTVCRELIGQDAESKEDRLECLL